MEDLEPTWGASWTDVDGDGNPDAFFSAHMNYNSHLFFNRDGMFFERSELNLDPLFGEDDHASAWGDFNGDGRVDVFSSNGYFLKSNLLAGTTSGFAIATPSLKGFVNGRYRSAVWADLNADGWDDLSIASWESADQLLLSRGEGQLEEVGQTSGVRNSFLKHGIIAADLDNDGDIDLIELIPEGGLVFMNRGDGSFYIADDQPSPIFGTRGDVGDIDGDGNVDLITNAGGLSFYRNDGTGHFSLQKNVLVGTNHLPPSTIPNLADLNNDGKLDVFLQVEESSGEPVGSLVYLQNDGRGRLVDRTKNVGVDFLTTGVPMAAAFADFNGDGRLDVLMTNGGGEVRQSGPHVLLKNLEGSANSLRVFTERNHGSRDGFGARVSARLPDGSLVVRDNVPIRAYAQDQEGVHIGLGSFENVVQVCVDWPDGSFRCEQQVPAGSAMVAALDAPHVLDSNPEGLLRPVRLESVDSARAFLKKAGRSPGVADPAELARRRDRLIAHALARDLLASIEIPDSELINYVRSRKPGFLRPARRWLDYLAYDVVPGEEGDLMSAALRTMEEIKGGASFYRAAVKIPLSAWRTSDPTTREYLPNVRRGFVESGWIPNHEIAERFSKDLAKEILGARQGDLLGVSRQRDTRRDLDRKILGIVHVEKVESDSTLSLDDRRDDLRRALTRRKLRKLIGRAAAIDPARRPSETDIIEGVRYSIPELAADAKANGYSDRPDIQRAFARIAEEVPLDQELVQWALHVPSSDLRIDDLAAKMKRAAPERIRGIHFFMVDGSMAAKAREALVQGMPIEKLKEKFDVRSLADLSGRFHNQYVEPFDFSAAILSRRIGQDGARMVSALQPGQVTPVIPPSINGANGFHFVRLDSRVPGEPWARQLVGARANREARRLRLQKASTVIFAP